ncbi:aconitase family protein [Escherichia coli]|nr:aconitase family protein [Escherichia coli]
MSSTLREASKDTLQAKDKTYHYYSLPLAAKSLGDITRLPKSLKVLLENLLRWQDGNSVTEEDIYALAGWLKNAHADREIAYRPARVLMQDFTGVPAVVDLAAMREAVKRLGGDTAKVNLLSPVDLVIDHSVTVDRFGDDEAFEENVRLEMERNHERYVFLKWESRRSVVLASCRQAQAFAIRLTSNISAKQCGANCRTVNGLLIRIHSLVLTRTPP